MKARLYVSADGCDAWEGTEARPLYTLEAAQERIERTWGFTGASGGASGAPLEGITIVVRGPGEYSGATRRWTRDGVVVEPRDPLGIAGAEVAPHLAEAIWQRLGHAASIAFEPWPSFDPALVVDDVVEIAVQVNGKVRSRVSLARDATEAAARAAIAGDEAVLTYTRGKTEKKFLYIPGRIINVVVA